MKKIIVKYWVIITAFLYILLRLPSLFEPFTYGDEGIYLTLGQAIRQGLVLYRDIHDNKPPLIYLIAAVAENFAYYRLILFFWGLATIAVFYKLAAYLFKKEGQKPAIIATMTFVILTSLHMFEGNIGNAENFMLLPILGGFWLILQGLEKNRILFHFLAGVLFSLATLFKVPAAFDFLAALAIIFLLNFQFREKQLLSTIRHPLSAIAGFLLPLLISFAYFASQGALNQYFTAAFAQNLPYLSSWGADKSKAVGLPLALLSRFFLVVVFAPAALFLFRKKISLMTKLLIIWFSFSLFAALLSSRPYPHYLIQILPSLSLAFGLWILPKRRLLPTILSAVLIIVWLVFRFWYYTNLPYLVNFYQYSLGLKARQAYLTEFTPNAEDIYRAGRYLRTHTQKNERIFIWGNDPYLYAISRRLPVGRYTVAYHIVDFDGYQETIAALTKNPPSYLIVAETESRPYPGLFYLINRRYTQVENFGPYRLFHRQLGV